MTRRLKGDASGIANLYHQTVTIAEAQAVVDQLCPRLPIYSTQLSTLKRVQIGRLGHVTVRFNSRATRRKHGQAIRIGQAYQQIDLYFLGLNIGTLLHELAHFAGRTGRHNSAFKEAQRLVYSTYNQLTIRKRRPAE